ncbi:15-hydroxyprostaglandin dehydrogenase [NAD(+)]-like [Periplaneta americana]|uniref:15-hydroxyprostaglandin dehydrogenase [NAD(+)]-like n=1 Tax=Periplaneta americana TaxID=6978 RepID=UPI0037E88BA9
MDPRGKAALATGAAHGLGLAISLELLRQGVKGVAVCDINVTEGEKAVRQMQKEFGEEKAIFIKTDVTNKEEFREAFKKATEKFGTLEIVINNAGIVDDQHWKQEVAVNLNGVIQGILLSLEYMGKDKGGNGGVVVNTSSLAGLIESPVMPVYCATKYGINGLTRSFGTEYIWNLTGVRVAAICPGYTATEDDHTSSSPITIREEWMPRLLESVKELGEPQKAENVSKSVLHIIREGPNGSLWVCINNEPAYQIKIPSYEAMRV